MRYDAVTSKEVAAFSLGWFMPMTGSDKSQSDKFKQAARELETDDDLKRFKERLGELVKHKPVKKSK